MGKVCTTTCRSFLKHQNVFWLEVVSVWIKSSFLGERDLANTAYTGLEEELLQGYH